MLRVSRRRPRKCPTRVRRLRGRRETTVLRFVSREELLRLRGQRNYDRYMLFTKEFVKADSPERAQWQRESAEESKRDAEWNLRHGPVPCGASILLFSVRHTDKEVVGVLCRGPGWFATDWTGRQSCAMAPLRFPSAAAGTRFISAHLLLRHRANDWDKTAIRFVAGKLLELFVRERRLGPPRSSCEPPLHGSLAGKRLYYREVCMCLCGVVVDEVDSVGVCHPDPTAWPDTYGPRYASPASIVWLERLGWT